MSTPVLSAVVGNRHRHHAPAAVVGGDRQLSAAHDLEPLPNVFQGDMRLAVIGRRKTAAVVRDDDLAAGIYWTLHEADHQQLSREAVNKVERNYSQQNVAVKYIEVYTNAIAQRTFRI